MSQFAASVKILETYSGLLGVDEPRRMTFSSLTCSACPVGDFSFGGIKPQIGVEMDCVKQFVSDRNYTCRTEWNVPEAEQRK